MRAGALDRRIALLAPGPVLGRDAMNAEVRGAPRCIHVAASYTPLSDAEQLAAGEVMASITARFRIRWSARVSCLSPLWWIEFDGRSFNISGVKEIGRREAIEITASARAER